MTDAGCIRDRDVAVIGGGVIGLSIAWELARHGVSVCVVDRQEPGREASWAGAGLLPPGNPDVDLGPEQRLRAFSAAQWPDWVARLFDASGVDSGFRQSGALELASDDASLDDIVAAYSCERISVRRLQGSALRQTERELATDIDGAVLVPSFCQVRNPHHLRALQVACLRAGVMVLPDREAVHWHLAGGRVHAVGLAGGERVVADRYVLAAGAWSRQIVSTFGEPIGIRPVRGQIVLLRTDGTVLNRIIQVGRRYLVPRPDGLVLVGSTEEDVGFVKRTTAAAVRELIDFAIRLVPALRDAEIVKAWAGLRPASERGLPYLGAMPGVENLFVAAGHFRSGLQNSPGTAVLLRQMILEQPLSIRCDEYAVAADRSPV